jgi:hypothetical protein
MYLIELLKSLRHRWYLVLTGTLLTVALTVAASFFVRPTYIATASVVLIPPKSTIEGSRNPYLNLGGLGPAVDVLGARVRANRTSLELASTHPRAQITVAPDTLATSAPILFITVDAPFPAESLAVRDEVLASVAPTLTTMQEELSIPNGSKMAVSTLASGSQPERNARAQLRVLILILGVGGALTVVGTGLIDGVLNRRGARQKASVKRNRQKRSAVKYAGGWWGDDATESSAPSANAFLMWVDEQADTGTPASSAPPDQFDLQTEPSFATIGAPIISVDPPIMPVDDEQILHIPVTRSSPPSIDDLQSPSMPTGAASVNRADEIDLSYAAISRALDQLDLDEELTASAAATSTRSGSVEGQSSTDSDPIGKEDLGDGATPTPLDQPDEDLGAAFAGTSSGSPNGQADPSAAATTPDQDQLDEREVSTVLTAGGSPVTIDQPEELSSPADASSAPGEDPQSSGAATAGTSANPDDAQREPHSESPSERSESAESADLAKSQT